LAAGFWRARVAVASRRSWKPLYKEPSQNGASSQTKPKLTLKPTLKPQTTWYDRLGAAELHVVAAVMGGMAAQEAIKLITRQFVPFEGTLIYNGIASTTSVLDL